VGAILVRTPEKIIVGGDILSKDDSQYSSILSAQGRSGRKLNTRNASDNGNPSSTIVLSSYHQQVKRKISIPQDKLSEKQV